MAQERKGVVTVKGGPVTLVGPELKAGDAAPNFTCVDNALGAVSLNQFQGKTVLISVVPSLDTPVCDAQTKRFNEEASKLPSNVQVLTVSVDLPFAQGRWCGAANAKNIKVISDHRDASFGQAYGVLIKELRLLARAIFIVNPQGKIQYAEVVKELTQHPNYDAALNALKQTVNTR